MSDWLTATLPLVVLATIYGCSPESRRPVARPMTTAALAARSPLWLPQYDLKTQPLGKTRYVEIDSPTIGQKYGFFVYLPPDYGSQPQRRFPVLYWLHGRNTFGRPSLETVDLFDTAMRAGECPQMIIVKPNGLDLSWWTDSKDGRWPVETVVMKDIIGYMDANCRTIASRDGRAIVGVSMGGYGAAYLGFKYPQQFCAVSIIAAAMFEPEAMAERHDEAFRSVFRSDGEYARTNSPWELPRANLAAVRQQKVRLFVGSKDRLKEVDKKYSDRLTDLGVQHTFTVVPDATHDVRTVYRNLGLGAFVFFEEVFGKERK